MTESPSPLGPDRRKNLLTKNHTKKDLSIRDKPLLHQSLIPRKTVHYRHLVDLESVPFKAISNDPADPPANHSILWHSNGTGSGDDGDIMMKITDSNGTTKTATVVDFSAA